MSYKALKHGSHSFTCKHHACLSFVNVHQMAPPQLRQRTSSCSLVHNYWPRRDERLSWPGCLTYSRRFTHISGHPSATDRAQDREVRRPKTDVTTTVPNNQPVFLECYTTWLSTRESTRFAGFGRTPSPPNQPDTTPNQHHEMTVVDNKWI